MALPEYYEDLDEGMLAYLRDQHPRGQQILDKMARRVEEEEEVPPYEKWTVEELKTELKARGLTFSGKHDDLVLRLYENDESSEEPE